MLNAFMFLIGGAVGYMIANAGAKRPAGKQRPTVTFTDVQISELLITGDIKKMELKEGQKAKLHVSLRTAHGHTGAIEPGSARWSTSDESVVSIEPNPENELEATIRGLDGSANESVVVEFRADGVRGEGVRDIVGTLDVTCTQGDAVVVSMEAGPVEDDAEAGEPQPAPIEGEGDAGPADDSGGSDLSTPAAEGGVADGEPKEPETPATEGGDVDGSAIAGNAESGVTDPGAEVREAAAIDGEQPGEQPNVDGPGNPAGFSTDGSPVADPDANDGPAEAIEGAGEPENPANPVEGTEAQSNVGNPEGHNPANEPAEDAAEGGPSNDITGPNTPGGTF